MDLILWRHAEAEEWMADDARGISDLERSLTSRGDHRRSAIAAVRGQMRESMVSSVTHSAHIVASPPRTCC